MRRRFLTVYDYGTGGIWQYITADSPEQLAAKYPKLTVLIDPPPWWKERPLRDLKTCDIDAEPTEFLRTMMGSPT
jgi:hypothetical protein